MKDFYYILGIEPNATSDEIKFAHRNLSKKFHPDLNPNDKHSEKMFKDIQEAYECLSDQSKRRQYDSNYNNWINANQSKNSSFESVFEGVKDNKGLYISIGTFFVIGFVIIQFMMGQNDDNKILWGLAGGGALTIFLTPFHIAVYNKHPLKWAVFAATLILGWTGLGWFGCLAFAIMGNKES